MEDYVKSAWEALCRRYTTDEALIRQLWDELEKAYTAKDRHYHNLEHIAYMLELADRYKQESPQQDLLRFAIFYHDIVYKATRSDNEEQSAALAEERLHRLGIPEVDILQVKEMIIATKSHQTHKNELINLLLDLDLAILGADQERYDRYSQGVRKEYSIYPDLIYKPGRRKVLQHFLAQEHIYKTPELQEAFEDKARENLQRELALYSEQKRLS
ncbi:HD domain-containing protein [Pontibacter lucknowensis]|uniref:Predicted metal-dependent phosphohydrolase, HD superfamily n=1 Tax=Pontibacter lucknowensis TaxID=1077936 RepID=A0A1N7AQ28_9BACT|nr:HD domain-containing protein [Pontibacter lucknowensis]SIR41098.1 Predicted metal-dependent phosphohydrolase, HD superfamily [Pontibacter lucknowensis]